MSVAYIMGSPRSGSTLLDTILAAHSAVLGTGELCHVTDSGWINGEYCACGSRGTECPFWTNVRHEWAQRVGKDDPHAYHEIVVKVEKSRRWMLQLPRPKFQQSELFREYARQTLALFQAIQTVSEKPLIVDSTKLRSRAYALSLIPGIDLRIIHLVRDVRGFVWSAKKRLLKNERAGVVHEIKPRPTWRAAVGWTVGNLQSNWVRRQLAPEHSIAIRYEDIATDPETTLASIGQLLGLSFDEVSRTLANGDPIDIGHTVAGSRMRMAGRVRLQPDAEWLQKMAARDKWLCWTIAGWLMRHYGYEKRPSRLLLPTTSVPAPMAANTVSREPHRV